MVTLPTVTSIFLKITKLALCTLIIILYRVGDHGGFLGVGGTWNLNEEKNADAEIVASGVFVGSFIYTAVSLIGYIFAVGDHKHTFTDVIMNIINTFMWLAVGATALHYWHGYQSEYKYLHVSSERQVGLALGSLCVFSGALYLLDSVCAVIHLINAKH